MSDPYVPWILLAVGAFVLLGVVINVWTGHTTFSVRKRWGLIRYLHIWRGENPGTFWLLVGMDFFIGLGVLAFATYLAFTQSAQ